MIARLFAKGRKSTSFCLSTARISARPAGCESPTACKRSVSNGLCRCFNSSRKSTGFVKRRSALFLDTFMYSTNFDKSSGFSTKTDSRFALETIAKKEKKWYNIVVSDEKGRKSERRKGMEEQRKATAEELAKKVAELMKEELVGVTSVDGTKISFYLAGGQKFCLTVTEAE